MKNPLICPKCKTPNPAYNITCGSCKSYLRERVVNIDLWDTLGMLLHSPSNAFLTIIRAEHKNFLLFIIFFVSIKFAVNSALLSAFINKNDPILDNFFLKVIVMLAGFTLMLISYSFLIKLIYNSRGWMLRIKDTLAVLTYSLIPHVYALASLFVIELIVFGGYIFSVNPSPFLFKNSLAWTLLSFEAGVVVWAIFLSYSALKTLLHNKLAALPVFIVFNLLVLLIWYLSSQLLFNQSIL